RVIGIGIETADMLVHEVLSRPMRDRKAVARYAGLTGSPDESGARRREQGLARAGNARVRRGMIQLAWRFLRFQNQSALAQWYRARTADSRPGTRKTMIVALARKLHRALALCHDWRDIGWRHPAPGRLKDLRDERLTYSALALALSTDCRLTIRGGGNRQLTWHTMPTKRMGPAARSFAADAHDCIMVRIQMDLPHTSVRREDAPMASSPRMIMTQTPELRNEKPIALFIVPPRAQAFKALRNTSDAKAARRQAPLAFRSLDPFRALREPDRRRRD